MSRESVGDRSYTRYARVVGFCQSTVQKASNSIEGGPDNGFCFIT